MLISSSQTSQGDSRLSVNEPKNQRIPSGLSIERGNTSGIAAVMSHDSKTNITCAKASRSMA
uniref:hypothetical protein n=1 Tax=Prevotella sp. TaxID=59823 RepID=UPI004027BC24